MSECCNCKKDIDIPALVRGVYILRIFVLMVRNKYYKDDAIKEVYKESHNNITGHYKFDFNQFKDLFNDVNFVKDDSGKYKLQ